jgi:hypothetical protein
MNRVRGLVPYTIVDNVVVFDSFAVQPHNNNMLSSLIPTTTPITMNSNVRLGPTRTRINPPNVRGAFNASVLGVHTNFGLNYAGRDSAEPPTTGSDASKPDGVESTCCICLCDLFDASAAVRMPRHCCSHVFHRDCIQKWMSVRRTCPLCRKNV